MSLIGVDVGNTSTRTSRFANYLRNLLPSNDTGVMEMAAKAIGRLAMASGTYTSEFVEFEVKRAYEWLSEDRIEGKRHAAVSLHWAETSPLFLSCLSWRPRPNPSIARRPISLGIVIVIGPSPHHFSPIGRAPVHSKVKTSTWCSH